MKLPTDSDEPTLKLEQSEPMAGAASASGRIGHYKILEQIGRGGMGAVYLAVRDDDQYRKRVAIKLIQSGMEGDETLRRFQQERQILASLEHDGIGKLLDGGSTDEGFPYLVMEYIEGLPIDRYSDNHKLSVEERLQLFRKVCAAVQFAHQNLVIHRDIKPGNVLVTADGAVKLLDFGIAKLLNPELSAQTIAPTRADLRVGTPEYASPEQIRGEPVSTATDIYSLGVLLYELLTGQRPYKLRSREIHEVARAICEEEPARPSTAVSGAGGVESGAETRPKSRVTTASGLRGSSPEKLRRRLSGDLDNIVLKALRKEPQRRYGSVEQLSVDVGRHLDGLPVEARKGTVTYRTGKFLRRHRVGVAVAAVALLSLVFFTVTVVRERDKAEQARLVAEEEAAKATAINAFLQDVLGSANPIEGQARDVTVLEALDGATERIDAAFDDQPDVEVMLRHTIGLTYYRLGRYREAEILLRQALVLGHELLPEDHSFNLNAEVNLALALHDLGRYDEAETYYRRALDGMRRTLGDDEQNVSAIRNNLALLLQDQGDYEAAEPLYREILASDRRVLGSDHVDVGIDLNNLGNLLRQRGDFAAAEPYLSEAVAIFRRHDFAFLPVSLATLASVRCSMGDGDRAESMFQEALVEGDARLGAEHGEVAKGRAKYGACLLDQKRYEDAESELVLAYDVLVQAMGPENRHSQDVAAQLFDLYTSWGRSDLAENYAAAARSTESPGVAEP